MTPLAFLDRASKMFARRTAVIDGDAQFTYGEFHRRVGQTAAVLHQHCGGDRAVVAVLAPNTRHLLEAHYAVPAAGCVLLALNTRLAVPELRHIIEHAGASLLVYDEALADLAGQLPVAALSMSALEAQANEVEPFRWKAPDENDLIALNYTSGTTGTPKGVMYHHRGAYLQALAMAYHAAMGPGTRHLWTLPMFHCNGWCFTWAVTAAGGTHVCLPKVEAGTIWRHLRDGGITHLNAAPTVLAMLAWDAAAEGPPLPRRVRLGTGGAPPSPALLDRMARLNFEVTHLYGLTETFGPVIACDWQPEWSDLPATEQACLAARQGNANVLGSSIRIIDGDERDVPSDAATIGEVVVRGNNVMLGYYRDEEATAHAFRPEGWFRTGDLAVMHQDGYIELRDRVKDVIISGGENISSIEVEQAIASHPAVLDVAVVAAPHERWGETPCAHIELKPGSAVTAEEIIEHVRSRIARFKAPGEVRFGTLPRTATGKIQKYQLRAAERSRVA